MQLKELVSFKKESFFDGAVQSDWFYDEQRSGLVATSYVFHGPKYFGVHKTDINASRHNLIDTVSFTNKIVEKIYTDKDTSRFLLTIAGYGAGKSHLAVTLAELLSGHNEIVSEAIIERICEVDEKKGIEIKSTIKKKNLVIVLNGMNNFNLDFEIMRCCKLALQQHGLDTSIVDDLTQAYNTAEYFVNNTYDMFVEKFLEIASSTSYKTYSASILKEKLLQDIKVNTEAFNIANEVYRQINGNYIRWDEGVTGANVISKISSELCGESKPFANVCILFDEFGRYIEYTADNPAVAGEAALQQIFEATQNANGKILFVGFIQSDLNSYIQRIKENTSIIRYVGRYEASDKYYLSSNFETVLANLIMKKNRYTSVVTDNFSTNYQGYVKKLHNNLNRWIGKNTKKAVWSDERLFEQIIIEGCYPVHPLTIWVLTNLSSWMQQRSTLTFVENILKENESIDVNGTNLLYTYSYPIEIIDSFIFNELYNAEEKGMQNSQHCLLYREIMAKYSDRLDEIENKVLKAIVITNICNFSVYDKADLYSAIRECTALAEEKIYLAIKNLEEAYGVLEYDEGTKRYYFVAEAKGKNEFLRVLRNKKFTVTATDISDVIDAEVLTILEMDRIIETPFGQQNKINSQEWKYKRDLISVIDFTDSYILELLRDMKAIGDAVSPRGRIITLYCTDDTKSYLSTVKELYCKYELNKYPVIVLVIQDSEEKLLNFIKERRALLQFTSLEQGTYEKFFKAYKIHLHKSMLRTFTELNMNKYIVTEGGIYLETKKMMTLTLEKFNSLYTQTVPFQFDGFDKARSNAVKSFQVICKKLLDKSIADKQAVEVLAVEIKNKIAAVLSSQSVQSWGILDKEYNLIEPQQQVLNHIYYEVINTIPENSVINGEKLLRRYLFAPYGFNYYSLALFVCYLFAQSHKRGILIAYKQNVPVSMGELINLLIDDKKARLDQIFKLDYGFMEKDILEKSKDLLAEIKANKNVEKCQDYLKQLNTFKHENVIPEELRVDVKYCEDILSQGIQLNNQITKRMKDTKDRLLHILAFKNPIINYEEAINILEKAPKSIQIVKSSTYKYSNEYLAEYEKIKLQIRNFLNDNIEGYVKSFKPDIRQIAVITQKTDWLYNQLMKIHLEDSAIRLKSLASALKKEIEEKFKYQEVIGSIEKDIRLWEEILVKGKLKELNSEIDQINLKKDYINKYITDIDIRNKYIEEICNMEACFAKKIDLVLSEIRLGINNIKYCKSIDELDEQENKLSYALRECIPEEYKRAILEALRDIKEVRQLLEEIKNEYDIDQIQVYLESVTKHVTLGQLIEHEVRNILKIKLTTQEKWKDNFLDNSIEINRLDAKECINFKEKLENYPSYFSKSIVEEIKFYLTQIENRLKECKIQGVVSLFEQLSSEEKVECLTLLSRNID